MKCNKCGYDFSGDPAHVCIDAPLKDVLRNAILRSSKVIEPQQRTWVGLTIEEANELWESTDSDWELMKRVEAKLKEKNT
jgi:hypothetical protein